MDRQQARDIVSRPGKFEGESPVVPMAYEIVLDGLSDTITFGSDGYVDCYDRVGHRWILHTDNVGFIRGYRYDTRAQCDAVWARLEAESERD